MIRIATLTALFIMTCHSATWATWSVIALDRKDGTVVIASATCVTQQAFARFPPRMFATCRQSSSPARA